MFKKINRKEMRKTRHQHIRKMTTGTDERPRLVVFKSLKHISAQIINDLTGTTLVAASTYEKETKAALKTQKKAEDSLDAAKAIGKVIAERAKGKQIEKVSFDRGGNLYTGRIKAFADAAREAGLKF